MGTPHSRAASSRGRHWKPFKREKVRQARSHGGNRTEVVDTSAFVGLPYHRVYIELSNPSFRSNDDIDVYVNIKIGPVCERLCNWILNYPSTKDTLKHHAPARRIPCTHSTAPFRDFHYCGVQRSCVLYVLSTWLVTTSLACLGALPTSCVLSTSKHLVVIVFEQTGYCVLVHMSQYSPS